MGGECGVTEVVAALQEVTKTLHVAVVEARGVGVVVGCWLLVAVVVACVLLVSMLAGVSDFLAGREYNGSLFSSSLRRCPFWLLAAIHRQ